LALLRDERLIGHGYQVQRCTYPQLLDLMVRAHNSGRRGLVHEVAMELHRRAHRRPNPRLLGLARAALVLASVNEQAA
jgi:hypothetical protein